MDSCAEQDLSRTTQASHPGSRKRVRAQMSPSSTIETEGPYDPVDESDESLAWAESFELNSQGKVRLVMKVQESKKHVRSALPRGVRFEPPQ